MACIVALVGRPNVGKSTLFNCLTGSHKALVADTPGVTRDRRYSLADHEDREYIVIDTGGFVDPTSDLDRDLLRQTEQAIEEAGVLVLLVDAFDGCVEGDRSLYARLRRGGKPVFIGVNKVDGRDAPMVLAEFAELGAPALFAISARRGHGVDALLEAVLSQPGLQSTAPLADPRGARAAVIGRPNAGKSTLINRLLRDDRLMVSPEPGTTRDSIDVGLTYKGRELTLVDTAGIRRKSKIEPESVERYSVLQALASVQAAQVVVAVIDADAGAAEQDITLIGAALEAGRAVVVAFNKCDLLTSERSAWAMQRLQRKLRFAAYLPVVRTSGIKGAGLGLLLRSVVMLYDAAAQKFPTPEVNRFLQQAVQQTPPPRVRGGRVRLRYAHQGGSHPIRIVLHGAHLDHMPPAYRRYLAGRFRHTYRLPGVPIVFVCHHS